MFPKIKDIKHIEQNFILLSGSCPSGGTKDAGAFKYFSMGICDCASSTARSSSEMVIVIPKFVCTHMLNQDYKELLTPLPRFYCTHMIIQDYKLLLTPIPRFYCAHMVI